MSKTPRIDEKEFKLYDESLSVPASVVRSSFARELETELSEARAEIERLNKSFGDSLDTIFAMLLAARGAECDIDTLKAEMKPVSSKPSEYIKHTIAERDKLIEQMREALENIRDYPGHIDYTTGEVHSMQEIAIAALAAERSE